MNTDDTNTLRSNLPYQVESKIADDYGSRAASSNPPPQIPVTKIESRTRYMKVTPSEIPEVHKCIEAYRVEKNVPHKIDSYTIRFDEDEEMFFPATKGGLWIGQLGAISALNPMFDGIDISGKINQLAKRGHIKPPELSGHLGATQSHERPNVVEFSTKTLLNVEGGRTLHPFIDKHIVGGPKIVGYRVDLTGKTFTPMVGEPGKEQPMYPHDQQLTYDNDHFKDFDPDSIQSILEKAAWKHSQMFPTSAQTSQIPQAPAISRDPTPLKLRETALSYLETCVLLRDALREGAPESAPYNDASNNILKIIRDPQNADFVAKFTTSLESDTAAKGKKLLNEFKCQIEKARDHEAAQSKANSPPVQQETLREIDTRSGSQSAPPISRRLKKFTARGKAFLAGIRITGRAAKKQREEAAQQAKAQISQADPQKTKSVTKKRPSVSRG